MNKRIIFSLQEEQNICSQYKNGISTVKLGNIYGVSHKTIARVLEKNNIPRTYVGNRKYYLNETYFDCIDTPNKAYILGLFFADGSNNMKKDTISISLMEEDVSLLERVRKEIGSSKSLEYLDYSSKHDFGYSYKNQYRLSMFSKHMSDSLNKIGMIPNKSLLLQFPIIDEYLYSHFIRGVFDGDGSLHRSIKNDKNHSIIITITSTQMFCDKLLEICQAKIGVGHIYDSSCHNGVTKVFTVSGRNVAKKFLDWIYSDCDLYLDRKYKRYIDYYYLDTPFAA